MILELIYQNMTSLIGVLVALFGAGGVGAYISKKFIVDPIREYRDIRKQISRDLVDYANLIANPGSGDSHRTKEAEKALRGDASDLKAAADDIPVYSLWAKFGIIPLREEVNEAKQKLIGLSNSLDQGNVVWNDEMRNKLKTIMGL